MKKHHVILAAIFIASFSGLSYEIILIRTFSVSLWYHFAFMVISIAMLGIGAGGTMLSVFSRLKNTQYLPVYSLMFSICLPASYLIINTIPFEPERLSWDRVQIFYISLYYILLALPFFFFGLIISTAFSTMGEYTRQIYGADLTGAGIGSLVTLWLLYAGGTEKIVFIVSSISILPLFFYSRKVIRLFAFLLFIANLTVLILHPSFINPRISPYKPLETALRFPGAEHLRTYYSPFSRVDTFKSPAVRFAPGLSFKYTGELPEQTGIAVDAGDIYAITKDKNKEGLAFLEYLPAALPYLLSQKRNVLILDPKGGLPVLIAEFYRSKNIFKIDSDPLVIKSVREYSRGFSSDIYAQNTWSGTGRSRLISFRKGFDLIDISLMGSMPSGSFGISEDYRFTVEAFEKYLRHLNPDGFLSVNLFIIPPPRTELRLVNTIATAFEKQGIKDFDRHIAAVRSWGSITMIVKKSPLSPEDINTIKGFAHDKRFDLIYYPGIREEETNIYIKIPSNEYFTSFRGLIIPGTRQQFTENYIFDIRAVYDENPFFHYYLKLENIRDIYKMMGGKWQYFLEEGYLLPAIFIQVVFLSMFLILLPALKLMWKDHFNPGPGLFRSLSYFAFLGIGFMFIEISLIQKMILPLENPSYAAAVVLSSILISSGVGSLLSQRSKILQKTEMLLALSIIILFYSLFLPLIMNVIYPYPLRLKIISVFFILMPAGILMGIPFPLGLSFLGKKNPSLIPWAWAVNGCFSVLAPILAVMFAISAGFKVVMLTGISMYVMAFFSIKLIKQCRDTSDTSTLRSTLRGR